MRSDICTYTQTKKGSLIITNLKCTPLFEFEMNCKSS